MNELLLLITEEIGLLRKQFFRSNGEKMQEIVGAVQSLLMEFCRKYAQEQQKAESVLAQFAKAVKALLEAMEREDYILCADLLETQVYPMAEEMTELLREEAEMPEENVRGRYWLEKAGSGDWTVRMNDEAPFYLHSTVNPRMEAKTWIEGVLELGKDGYVLWGLGLGYHAEAVCEKVRGRIPVKVYEPDQRMIELAKKYGRWEAVESGEIEVVHDPEGMLFAEAAGEGNVQVMLHWPSVKKIENEELRRSFQKFFISDSTAKEIRDDLLLNFISNTKLCKRSVDDVLDKLRGKKVIVVAGGPSLDKNIGLLKRENRDYVIIAVGTVFGKMIRLGIVPDYVVFMDAQERTFRQLKELLPLKLQVPILVDSTACWELIKQYTGPKYIAYQYGYDRAEQIAKERQYTLFETGGTVTSLAIDIAIRGRAEAVICIGMDLAYTGGVTHTKGTMDYTDAEQNEEAEVMGYYGGTVKTTLIFQMYKEWIERRIERCGDGITFVNATEGGVYVKGMRHEPLEKWIASDV